MKVNDKTSPIHSLTPHQISEPGGVLPGQETEGLARTSKDRVDVSDAAQRKAFVQRAIYTARTSSGIDVERVAAMKQAIADGSYKPDLSQVAETILQEVRSFLQEK